MPTMTDKALQARDAKRDIGAELLQSVRDMKAGRWGRKTTIEIRPDGSVRRRIELPGGKVAKDEILTGARWALLSARSSSGLSQADFADALGVSKRTLENWEQGRAEPTGPAKVLLNLVVKYPDTVKRLAKMRPEEQSA
ncbi:MAG: helix-turn-helix domain-containing protein [Sulfuritalea sp.]|jgi:putative transcriptional regulator|nr:helix-turn-helix domain-containing protein [Sulfuritalea sp.]MDP1983223.1 helix-turn-helix domain-containing protein [Sulfuritalea sp.]